VEKVEAQFESPVLTSTLDVRETVSEAYGKISKTMFDSLQAIAKDSSSHQASGSKDDDDKEQLNSHISMIENMYYYRETVDDRGNKMLLSYKTKAQGLYAEHLASYLNLVIRRPLGRLLVHPHLVQQNLITGLLTRCRNICRIKPFRRCNRSHLLLEIRIQKGAITLRHERTSQRNRPSA